jgi:hypothetical protein
MHLNTTMATYRVSWVTFARCPGTTPGKHSATFSNTRSGFHAKVGDITKCKRRSARPALLCVTSFPESCLHAAEHVLLLPSSWLRSRRCAMYVLVIMLLLLSVRVRSRGTRWRCSHLRSGRRLSKCRWRWRRCGLTCARCTQILCRNINS